jgi:hypothetical protein
MCFYYSWIQSCHQLYLLRDHKKTAYSYNGSFPCARKKNV